MVRDGARAPPQHDGAEITADIMLAAVLSYPKHVKIIRTLPGKKGFRP
jgi:hypothetical protein